MKILINWWRSLTPLTQNLGKFALFNIGFVNFFVPILFSTPWTQIGLYYTEGFLRVTQYNSDSWIPMRAAFEYFQSHQQQLLYSEVFFEQHTKFQYPPTSLLTFDVLHNLDRVLEHVGVFSLDPAKWAGYLRFPSWIFVAVMAVFSIKIFNLSLARNTGSTAPQAQKADLLTRNILLVCLFITFYPVIKAYTQGQIQGWINSLFSIVFWCWLTGKTRISGALSGVICLIKPQFSIVLLWGLLRRQWAFVLAFVMTSMAILLVSIAIFGLANHLDYLKVLAFISRHGESYYPNQSVNGLLNRLLSNGKNLSFDPKSFPPFNPWVYIGTTTSSVIAIALALFWPMKTRQRGDIDFCIVALTSTMASPIAWEHHYGILLPIYAYLLPCLLKQKVFGLAIPYLGLSYVLTSNYFAVSKKLAHTPFNFIQSYLFLGGLMVLVCLYVLRNKKIGTSDEDRFHSISM